MGRKKRQVRSMVGTGLQGQGRRRYARAALIVGVALALIVALQAALPWVASLDLDLSLDALARGVRGHDVTGLLVTYGYWAVLVFVAVESMGIPFPGETMLLAAAIYAGTTHRLEILLVIVAAAAGAILGDNVGYLAGREGGYRLLRRYGRYIRLDERKLKLGQYLFQQHGGKVVFFGRFVAVLRIWAAFLAGTYRLSWRRFLVYNAAGGGVWATVFGLGGYLLGDNVHRLGGPLGVAGAAGALIAVGAGLVFLRRNEHRLAEDAERALPGPLGDTPPEPLGRVAVR